MKYVKEELENLIFIENLSYREIGRRYNVSDTYIKKICNKLGISLKKRANFPEGHVFNRNQRKPATLCLNCGEECDIYAKKYCSNKCQNIYTTANLYKDFLDNNEKYCRANYNAKVFKPFFLQEQNGCCDICGMSNTWNDKSIVFVLDHIDGNAANNHRSNLRLVCPNCDSQLDTYKSKNKNSARTYRYAHK